MIKKIIRLSAFPDCGIISLADAKAQLRIEPDFIDDDYYINQLIGVALDKAERITDKVWLESEFTVVYESIATGTTRFDLDRDNVVSVDAVAYVDSTGALVTIDSEAYTFDEVGACLWPVSEWPAGIVEMRIDMTLGAENPPPSLIHAVKLYVTDFYETRQNLEKAKSHDNMAANSLLYPLRDLGL